jgi:putative ABC transport system permease protein
VPGGGQARELTENDMEALADSTDAPDVATTTPVVGGAVLLQVRGDQYRASITAP